MRKYKTLLILLLSPLILVLAYKLYNYCITDQTARLHGGESLFFNEVVYEWSSFTARTGTRIAKTRNGFDINRVVGDPELNCVIVSGWLEYGLYVKEDYQIITEGKVTSVIEFKQDITDNDFCEALGKTIESKSNTFIYKTDNLPRDASEISIFFENCPLGLRKYIGFLKDKWVYIHEYTYNPDAEDEMETYIATCKIIDQQYVPIIESYIDKKGAYND